MTEEEFDNGVDRFENELYYAHLENINIYDHQTKKWLGYHNEDHNYIDHDYDEEFYNPYKYEEDLTAWEISYLYITGDFESIFDTLRSFNMIDPFRYC